MTAEEELLARLRSALADADATVDELVDEAWEAARGEVRQVLRRLMTQDLLTRAIRTLEGGARRSSPRADADAGTPPTASARSTYLYGITRPELPFPVDDLPRLPGGGPPRLIPHGRLAAVVCDVDPDVLARIDGEDAEALGLLTDAARGHDTVLATLAEGDPVLPLRLGTVVADDDVVVELLEANERRLAPELDRVDGHAEWAVTVHVVRPSPDAGGADVGRPTSGRDYLEARRTALQERERRQGTREGVARSIHEELSGHAVDSQRVTDRPLEDGVPPLLHGVYLVADHTVTRFQRTVEDLRERHEDAVIEVSGPWPPYHFTSVDLDLERRQRP